MLSVVTTLALLDDLIFTVVSPSTVATFSVVASLSHVMVVALSVTLNVVLLAAVAVVKKVTTVKRTVLIVVASLAAQFEVSVVDVSVERLVKNHFQDITDMSNKLLKK